MAGRNIVGLPPLLVLAYRLSVIHPNNGQHGYYVQHKRSQSDQLSYRTSVCLLNVAIHCCCYCVTLFMCVFITSQISGWISGESWWWTDLCKGTPRKRRPVWTISWSTGNVVLWLALRFCLKRPSAIKVSCDPTAVNTMNTKEKRFEHIEEENVNGEIDRMFEFVDVSEGEKTCCLWH